jgi:2-polyprenyl-3-methyl-5-hydroxy-6-metoxy-1,4-benzoquinol methylase
MKNILDEKPSYELNGRLLESVNFVVDDDFKGKDVLDVGCGYGWFELNALSRGVNKIVGIEISESDLKTAKENIISEKVEFKIGVAIKLPFKDNSFDTIVCWEVIEHIPKNMENLMFSEFKRVLRPNGVFYLSTPNTSFYSNIFDPAWWLIGHRHYALEKLKELARQNSFEVLKIRVKGGFWSLFFTINMYISKWIFRRRAFLKEYFISKENTEYGNFDGFVNIFMKFRKIL